VAPTFRCWEEMWSQLEEKLRKGDDSGTSVDTSEGSVHTGSHNSHSDLQQDSGVARKTMAL
jgi:hypothetical protein